MESVISNFIKGVVFVSALWLIVDFLVNWVLVHLGAKWADIFHATRTRAFVAALGVTFGPGLVTAALWAAANQPTVQGLVLGLIVGLGISLLIVRAVYNSTWTQAGLVTMWSVLGHTLGVICALAAAGILVPLLAP